MRTLRPLLFILAAVTLLLSWSLPNSNAEAEIAYYISPEGSDSFSGTSVDQAFATLEKARQTIRALKQDGGLKAPVNVYLLGGTYELSEPFYLEIEDSGTEACPINYRAYNKEEVLISGGREIRGPWEPYKGNIVVCTIPEAKDGNWRFRQLFLNGERMIRARTPDIDEYYRIAKTDRRMDRNELPFIEGDVKKWNNLDEAEVVVFHSWNDSRLFISDVDEEERILTFTGSIGRRLRGGATSSGYGGTRTYANRYFVENILEGLDQPGEWYLDTETGQLYLYPTENLSKSELRAPLLHPLIVLSGDAEMGDMVRYVGFSGLTFADVAYELPEEGIPTIPDVGDIYRPAAIIFAGTKFCSFENNCIRNVGNYAMEVIGDANTITRNEIYDAGGGGFITRSFRKEPNVFTYNHIHDCGKVWFSACGINVDDGGGVIAHNLIHDLPQTGVYARHWATETQEQERWNQEQTLLIEYNEIHDVGSKINDCAGIFVRDSNIVINNNLIYNVYSYMYDEMRGLYNDQGVPGWGIYLGCETRFSTVENNLVYNINEGMHILHGARHNTIQNNIFVNCLKRQIRYESNTPMPGNWFFKNILYNTRPYSEIFNCGREHDHPEVSDYNVFYYSGGKTPIIGDSARVDPNSYGAWLERGYEENSVIADPLFRDPANHDYSLLPESPALKLGFKPINMEHVGLDGIQVGPALNANKPQTIVSIQGEKFLINGIPTYQGCSWNGYPVEGLLMNSRMVQGIFDDLNPETSGRWKYDDTQTWDPDRNTREFVKAMDSWYAKGLLAFTINMQGGSPLGYGNKGWINSAYDKKGELRPEYMARLERILDRANEIGMVAILGLFYNDQEDLLENDAAVINGVDNVIAWLHKNKYRNVIIEINNECNLKYVHEILRPERVHEVIERIQSYTQNGFRYLAGTSYSGGVIPGENVVSVADFILLHGNGVHDPARILAMVEQTKELKGYRPVPILFNEDDHFEFDTPSNNFVEAVKAYASWGYFDYRMKGEGFENGFQSVPVNWNISSPRKTAFFNKLEEITGGPK